MKKADIGVALYILAAFIMLIVPIPNTLLDILLALNMSIAFTILFGVMFSKNKELTAFPHFCNTTFEIIGNEYDNPELLGGE